MSRVAIRRTAYGDYGAHPTPLLRLRGVAKSTPRAVGVWLGVLVLCPYSTCCTFKHFCGDFDSDLGTINSSSSAVRWNSAFRAAQCGTQRIARDSAPPKRTFRDQILGETVCVPGSV